MKIEVSMIFLILTTSLFKKNELEKYFAEVGLKTLWIKSKTEIPIDNDYFLIKEQTSLINTKGILCEFDSVEKCVHHSNIEITIKQNDKIIKKEYHSSVEGFVFPNLRKEKKKDVYSWDDIFVSKNSHLSNQQLKEKGLKNSARDMAFSLMAEDLKEYFTLKNQMNLNFNPIDGSEIISFDPVIYNLIKNNPVYSIAYENDFFKPLLNKVLNNGLFIRKAKNRAQKNYWLPGVNAGIPLTPKKDDIHELTFMFHDIMHFLFPDFILTGKTEKDKKIYIISRMMSEAFTIIMADFLFIDLLYKENVEYDFTKRKIYPLFKNLNIKVSADSLKEIKEVLYNNGLFVLLGKESLLKEMTNNDINFKNYKEKYQPFFTEDYIWTNKNAEHFKNYAENNKKWFEYVNEKELNNLKTTEDFNYLSDDIIDIYDQIFNYFFSIIENAIKEKTVYDEVLSYRNAYKSYLSGQMMIFYNYSPHYNKLFQESIEEEIIRLNNSLDLLEIKRIFTNINNIYCMYLDTLAEDNLISKYKAEQYKNIYPMFEPFYVFYDKKENKSFEEVLKKVLGENNE